MVEEEVGFLREILGDAVEEEEGVGFEVVFAAVWMNGERVDESEKSKTRSRRERRRTNKKESVRYVLDNVFFERSTAAPYFLFPTPPLSLVLPLYAPLFPLDTFFPQSSPFPRFQNSIIRTQPPPFPSSSSSQFHW